MLIKKAEYEQINKHVRQKPRIEIRVVQVSPQRQRHQKEPLNHFRGNILAQMALNSGSRLKASGKFWEQLYAAIYQTN